ncbi:MAG: Zn-ribbon domain-containing OB-fold protein [Candidatus Thorarchaeota archaeon]
MYIIDEFYEGLDEKIIYGAKCAKCGLVYFPPKMRCQSCLEEIGELIELPPIGILKNYIEDDNSKRKKKIKETYGLVQIEMSDTPVIMRIFNTTPKKLKAGMKLKVVWENGKLTDTPHIIGFEPL